MGEERWYGAEISLVERIVGCMERKMLCWSESRVVWSENFFIGVNRGLNGAENALLERIAG